MCCEYSDRVQTTLYTPNEFTIKLPEWHGHDKRLPIKTEDARECANTHMHTCTLALVQDMNMSKPIQNNNNKKPSAMECYQCSWTAVCQPCTDQLTVKWWYV